MSPTRPLGAHLRSVAQIATTADTPAFLEDWVACKNETEMRSLLLRDERFLQLTVHEGGGAGAYIGRSLRDLGFPAGALLALVHRNDEAFVPTSEDVVQDGDRLTIIGNPDAIEALRERLESDAANDA